MIGDGGTREKCKGEIEIEGDRWWNGNLVRDFSMVRGWWRWLILNVLGDFVK